MRLTVKRLIPLVLIAALLTGLPVQAEAKEELPEESYLLTFVGDCTFGGNPNVYYSLSGFIRVVGDDYRYPFRNVISYFERDDFTFANLEGTLCEKGDLQKRIFNFRGPTDYVNILTQNSVECVTLANNHTMDYGESGYASTKETLEKAGVPYVEQNSSTVITLRDGLTVGIYATTYGTEDMDDLVAEITAMKEQGVDVIIYAAHWGAELSYRISDLQEKQAHAAIDAGANIVYGSHPHVLQPIEKYKDGIIYYSLGNFSFGGNGGPRDKDTVIIQQEVICKGDGSVELGRLVTIPCCISSDKYVNNYQPTPYAVDSPGYTRALRKLSGTF